MGQKACTVSFNSVSWYRRYAVIIALVGGQFTGRMSGLRWTELDRWLYCLRRRSMMEVWNWERLLRLVGYAGAAAVINSELRAVPDYWQDSRQVSR